MPGYIEHFIRKSVFNSFQFKQMWMQHNANHKEMEWMENELKQLNCNKAAMLKSDI